MKNLIYQNWSGIITNEVKVSSRHMKMYSEYVGADYRFDINPNISSKLCKIPYYYECFNFLFDSSFDRYDNILVVDSDIFVTKLKTKNIFEEEIKDIGISLELHQPELRKKTDGKINFKNDEKWYNFLKEKYNIVLPRDNNNDLKIYNSGVVLWSRTGIEKSKKEFLPFQEYINFIKLKKLPRFYSLDQPYLHAMIFFSKLNYTELDNIWNSFVCHTRDNLGNLVVNDDRTTNSIFVHNQLKNTDNLTDAQYEELTNLSINNWSFTYNV